MRRLIPFLLVAALAPGCKDKVQRSTAPSQRAVSSAGPAYDLTPLLSALRPGVPEEVVAQLKLDDLTELPFYDLDLALSGDNQLAARTTLYYRNRTGQPLGELPLLLHANAPRELGQQESGQVTISSAEALAGPAVTLVRRRPTAVALRFARPLAPGEQVELSLRWQATLRQLPPGANDLFGQALGSLGMSSGGTAASDYGLLARGEGILTVASACPVVAPYRDGAFADEKPGRFGDLAYGDLANYRARVAVPAGYLVTTNLQDAPSPVKTAGGALVFHAAGAANRDFVLVAGRGLEQATVELGDIKVRSTFRAQDKPAGERALRDALGSLELFQERLGAYPYRELDVAQASLVGGAGGVEFPGMVLIAGMLYAPPSKSQTPLAQLLKVIGGLGGALGRAEGEGSGGLGGPFAQMDTLIQDMALFTVAHEVAHQYFAGLVGVDCRSDAAVDEPAAQYFAAEYAKQAKGPQAGQDLLDLNARLSYGLYRMLGGKDRAAAQPVSAFPSALAYAAIVYGKAPYFYRELRQALGDERFFAALRHAVSKSRFRTVDTPGWIALLEQGAAAPAGEVRRLAQRWLYQRHGDEDLGLDGSGRQLLVALLGEQLLGELDQGLGLLGMKPQDLLRLLMGKLLQGESEAGAATGTLDPLRALQELQGLGQ